LFASIWLGYFGILILAFPSYRTHVEIDFYTDTASFLKVFWPDNAGRISERHSTFIKTRKGRHVYSFFFDADHPLHELRIIPTKKPAVIMSFHRLSLQRGSFPTHSFSKKSLAIIQPSQRINRFSEASQDAIHFVSKGKDPELSIVFEPIIFNNRADTLSGVLQYMTKGLISLLLGIGTASLAYLTKVWLQIATKYQNQAESPYNDVALKLENRLPRFFAMMVKVAALLTICYLIFRIINVFGTRNIFGTANAPYSDAFLWLRGTLHYLDGLPFKTYRPTINLFFASIYSGFARIHAIPFFSIIYLTLNLFLFVVLIKREQTITLLSIGVFFLLFFNKTILPLNVGQLMIDFLPFSMTLVGLLLTTIGLKYADSSKKWSIAVCSVGLLLLGIASAVRGVQLLGGILVVLMVMIVWWHKTWRHWSVLALIIFLLPLVVDVSLQKLYGAENNAIFSLFGFYNDISHAYTKQGKIILRQFNIPYSEVMLTYLRYLFSPQGLRIFLDYLEQNLTLAIQIVFTKTFYLLFGATTLLSIARQLLQGPPCRINPVIYPIIAVHFVVLPVLYNIFPDIFSSILFAYSIVLIWISFGFRYYATSCFLSLFIGGSILFAMLGQPGGERVAAGFIFALPLSWITLIIDSGETRFTCFKPVLGASLIINILLILSLYTFHLLLPLPDATRLERMSAIKISEDQLLNLNLYYAEGGIVFYTEMSSDPVGSIKIFTEIDCPDGTFNSSFYSPCKFR
jgi:hypothetical protein